MTHWSDGMTAAELAEREAATRAEDLAVNAQRADTDRQQAELSRVVWRVRPRDSGRGWWPDRTVRQWVR